ncbi:Uncharacterised protein [Cedecea neteri]|nr:hypothetical protein CO704_25775 [Cedecea neteri]SQC92082.1 Uncharacterised protein [Cedecea neteri]
MKQGWRVYDVVCLKFEGRTCVKPGFGQATQCLDVAFDGTYACMAISPGLCDAQCLNLQRETVCNLY